jgi:hypothetical protein
VVIAAIYGAGMREAVRRIAGPAGLARLMICPCIGGFSRVLWRSPPQVCCWPALVLCPPWVP